MKKLMIVTLSVFALLFTANVYAQQKGASEKAYEHASDEAIFNRVGDWFATVGKSKEEKAKIKTERKAERAKKKAEKKAKKMKEEAEEEAEEAAEKAEKKMKKMKKESKGLMKKGS